MTNRKWRTFSRAFIVLTLLALVGCAFNPSLVDHSFSFDASRESNDVEVLNYKYGNSKTHSTHPSEASLKGGEVRQGANVSGEMLRGDFLYVKWRIKSTGEVFEDTVDLRSRLPVNIKNYRIHFIIKGPQLYVFLISPDRLEKNPCPSRQELTRLGKTDVPFNKVFSMYCYLKITPLYPDQVKP